MGITLDFSATEPGRPRKRAVDIDRHVGVRMRERRSMLGMTQTDLADAIGVTYQQAHKYEKGSNRIAAGRLYRIAQALGVSVDYLFEGIDGTPRPASDSTQRQMLDLASHFLKLDQNAQKAISALARALAQPKPGEPA